jgi:rubrerythrin
MEELIKIGSFDKGVNSFINLQGNVKNELKGIDSLKDIILEARDEDEGNIELKDYEIREINQKIDEYQHRLFKIIENEKKVKIWAEYINKINNTDFDKLPRPWKMIERIVNENLETNLDKLIQRQQHTCETLMNQIRNSLKNDNIDLRDLQKHKNMLLSEKNKWDFLLNLQSKMKEINQLFDEYHSVPDDNSGKRNEILEQIKKIKLELQNTKNYYGNQSNISKNITTSTITNTSTTKNIESNENTSMDLM